MAIIVVGFDASGMHLHQVDKKGASFDADKVGWTTIGAGEAFSAISLVQGKRFSVALGLAEAIYHVLVAKKMAEADLVDQETDITIVREGEGIQSVSPEGIKNLERIYQSKRRLSAKDQAAILKAIQPA